MSDTSIQHFFDFSELALHTANKVHWCNQRISCGKLKTWFDNFFIRGIIQHWKLKSCTRGYRMLTQPGKSSPGSEFLSCSCINCLMICKVFVCRSHRTFHTTSLCCNECYTRQKISLSRCYCTLFVSEMPYNDDEHVTKIFVGWFGLNDYSVSPRRDKTSF